MSKIFEGVMSDYNTRSNISLIVDIIIDKATNEFNEYFTKANTPFTSYVMSYIDIEDLVDEYFPPFKILLREPLDDHTIKAAYSKKYIVFVMVDFEKDLEMQLVNAKKFIVHELIHHRDHVISKGLGKDSVGADGQVDYDEYYNNDSEVNAFYHEALYDIEKTFNYFITSNSINSVRYENIAMKWWGTFEKFKESFSERLDKDFKEHSSESTKRKVNKRLYGYYTDIFQPKLIQGLADKKAKEVK